MATTAADLPEELFSSILNYVAYDSGLWDSEWINLRPEQKQQLSACSLVCLWWAEQCRHLLFAELTFRSLADLDIFYSFVESTPKRLVPLDRLLQRASIEQDLKQRTWFHTALDYCKIDWTVIRPRLHVVSPITASVSSRMANQR